MRKVIALAVVAISAAVTTPAFARDVTVEITNLTNGIWFTPLLIAVHDEDTHLFQAGMAASTSLQAMAEGGNISGLVIEVEAASGQVATNPAGGASGPGRERFGHPRHRQAGQGEALRGRHAAAHQRRLRGP